MRIHPPSMVVGAVAGALAISLVSFVTVGARPTEAQMDPMLAVQKAQVMAVTYQVDNAGLHDLDEKLSSGQMVAGTLGRVRRARIATQNTMWPSDAQATANELVEHLMALESALRDEDVIAAAPNAHEVHDLAHKLSDQAYGWLAGAAPSPAEPMHTH